MSLEVFQGTTNPQRVQTRTVSNRLIAEPYINEPPGTGGISEARIIRVRRSATGTPVAVNPGNPGTVAGPAVQWVIQADRNNLNPNYLGTSFRSEVRDGSQTHHLNPGQSVVISAPQLQFRVSQYGIDKFLVNIQGTSDSVRIDVWRRIYYRYIRLQKTSSSGANDLEVSSTDLPNGVLDDALNAFEQFGIYFEPNTATTGGPAHNSQVAPPGNSATLTTAQLRTVLGVNGPPASRPEREIRICAAERFQGATVGWGGGNLAAVACEDINDKQPIYIQLQQSFEQYRNQHRPSATPFTTDGVAGVSNSASGRQLFSNWVQQQGFVWNTREEQFYEYLVWRASSLPQRLVTFQKYLVLLHEIGHALGLVPSSGQAAGNSFTNWHDAAHTNHCQDDDCVMWWELDTDQSNLWSRPRSSNQPLFLNTLSTVCRRYLRTCDLHDIRNLP